MPSTKPSRTPVTALLCVLMGLALCGCGTTPKVKQLLQHPEFPAAAQFAPNFTADALKALADYERKSW
jgi:hypothetical protein